MPTAWLAPTITWHRGDDENSAVAELTVGGHKFSPQITGRTDGCLGAATMPRWAKPNGLPWGEYPRRGTVCDEARFAGIRIPTGMDVGYLFGTDQWVREFLRATVTNAIFL